MLYYSIANFHPLALLKDTLEDESTEVRLKTLDRLVSIAAILEPERIRSELVPYLTDFVTPEVEDECLLKLAEQLGKWELFELIGGPPYVACLLPLLEKLAGIEETVVRSAASAAMKEVVSNVSDIDVNDALDVIKRLSEGTPPDNWYTSRVSACSVVAALYPKSAHVQPVLIDIFTKLANDDTPMVRRSAASNLHHLCAVASSKVIETKLIPLFNTLFGDAIDSVRLNVMTSISEVSACMNSVQCEKYILPYITLCANEKSWRLRQSIAKNFTETVAQLPTSLLNGDISDILVILAKDTEADVRMAAIKNVPSFFEVISEDTFKSKIFPLINEQESDVNPAVRLQKAKALMALADKYPDEVVESVVNLLHDESNEVRLTVLTQLNKLADASTDVIETSVIPAILDLVKDNQWRVREAVICSLPRMAQALGPAFFDEKILSVYKTALSDKVNAVRMTTTESLKDLCSYYGESWTADRFIPELTKIWKSAKFYVEKITVLYAYRTLCEAMGNESIITAALPVVLAGCKDNTPNVKFVAVQTLEVIIPHLDDLTKSNQIRPCLEEMQRDTDSDVQFYSSICLDTMV